MINSVWLFLIFISVFAAAATGNIHIVTDTIFKSAGSAIEFCFGLAGAIAFWSGILKVAEYSGVTAMIAKLFQPILIKLFPKLRANQKTLGLISLTIAANLLGLSNVATPIGLKTMEELQKINPEKERASDEICTFLVIILGGLSLLPTTLMAIRAQAGSHNPAIVLGPLFLITLSGTAFSLLVNYIFIKLSNKKSIKRSN